MRLSFSIIAAESEWLDPGRATAVFLAAPAFFEFTVSGVLRCPGSHQSQCRLQGSSAMNPRLDQHAISRNLERYCKLHEGLGPKALISIGAASGDRTHDILSHSQAFCR